MYHQHLQLDPGSEGQNLLMHLLFEGNLAHATGRQGHAVLLDPV